VRGRTLASAARLDSAPGRLPPAQLESTQWPYSPRNSPRLADRIPGPLAGCRSLRPGPCVRRPYSPINLNSRSASTHSRIDRIHSGGIAWHTVSRCAVALQVQAPPPERSPAGQPPAHTRSHLSLARRGSGGAAAAAPAGGPCILAMLGGRRRAATRRGRPSRRRGSWSPPPEPQSESRAESRD
jgi:hypothetical protein